MALLLKAISYYYPQCSGMPTRVNGDHIEDGNDDSVTPLKFVQCRNSRIPSVTDLTGLEKIISSTAAPKEKPPRSTAARDRPTRSNAAAAARDRPSRSTVTARNKPSRCTAGRDKPPFQSTVATVHSSADLMTSTVISMPEAIENENYLVT